MFVHKLQSSYVTVTSLNSMKQIKWKQISRTQVWQYYKWIFPRITPALPRMKSSRHILTRNRSCCTQLVQGDDNTTRYGDRLHATQQDFCCSLHRSNSVNNKGRPNFVFGFGFGAECVHCSTFGMLSVSAESNSCHFR